MSFENLGFVEVEIDSEVVSFDLDNDFDVEDIDEGMRKTPAMIAYVGAVCGATIRYEKRCDARYRQWRAQMGKEIVESEPKMAQTKINQIVEADEMFIVHKDRIADAARNVETMRGVFEAFKTKAHLLQSKGAMERAALESTGMTTKVSKDPEPARTKKAKDKKLAEKARAAVGKTKAKASEKSKASE